MFYHNLKHHCRPSANYIVHEETHYLDQCLWQGVVCVMIYDIVYDLFSVAFIICQRRSVVSSMPSQSLTKNLARYHCGLFVSSTDCHSCLYVYMYVCTCYVGD